MYKEISLLGKQAVSPNTYKAQLVNKNLQKKQLRLSFSGSLLFFEKNGVPIQNKKAKPVSQFKKRFQEKRPESNTYSRSRQT